jgi:hypothetical protein
VSWAFWLSIPAAGTVLAALVSWWRGRPKRAPTTAEAMRAHDDFLEALAEAARSGRPGPTSD